MIWAYFVLSAMEEEFTKKKSEMTVMIFFTAFFGILFEYLCQRYYFGQAEPIIVMH